MEKVVVAVPSAQPGGMDAPVHSHFGHCDGYTLVTVEDGKIEGFTILPAIEHAQGGCMAPVNYLADNGVKVLISGGMGLRPLLGFEQVGIDVFHGAGAPTVGAAMAAYAEGQLQRFNTNQTCGGGH